MQPFISKNIDDLAIQVAEWFIDHVKEVLQKQDRFTVALSGGSTPKKLFKLFASGKYKDQVDWSKLHFFWGDERYVPFDDERNNAKMATDLLFDHVPIVKEQIHIMRTDIPQEESVKQYEDVLKKYFADEGPSFDLVFLGMGGDGHTLSLFPGQENIHEKEKWVMAFYLEEQKMHRITLTAPIVNRACKVVFMVAGADKAAALFQVLYGEHDPDLYPSQLIQPYQAAPIWFIDEAAAKELKP